MIGAELVPGLPETRRPDQCPLGDVEAVAAELVVSAVRRLVVRKYERAGGPAPAVVAWVLEIVAGEPGRGAGAGDVVVLYSESLGDAARVRRLLRRGGGPLSRVAWDTAARADAAGVAPVRRAPAVALGRRAPRRRWACDQLIDVGDVRGRAPRGGRWPCVAPVPRCVAGL
jgi:hypothetical protein